MSKASSSSWLRKGLIWFGPIVILLLALICGFLYWVIATPAGTRWAVHTGVYSQKGTVQGVRGSLWQGLSFEYLDLPLPDDLHVQVQQLELQVDWAQLWRQRQLRIQALKVGSVAIRLPEQDSADDEKTVVDFELPELPDLPLSIAVDELYLGNLDVHIGAHHLDRVVSELEAQIDYSEQLALFLHQVHLTYETAQATVRGRLDYGSEQAAIELDISQAVYEDFAAAAQLEAQVQGQQAQAQIKQLQVSHKGMHAQLTAQTVWASLSAPWDSTVKAHLEVESEQLDAPICAAQYVPHHLHHEHSDEAVACALSADLSWQGSLASGQLLLEGQGQGFHLEVQASVQPEAVIPVDHARVRAQLPDHSSLNVDFEWHAAASNAEQGQVVAHLDTENFNLGAWLERFGFPMTALLTLDLDVQAQVDATQQQLFQASTAMHIHEGTVWNAQPAQGHVDLRVARQEEPSGLPVWLDYALEHSDANLKIGANQILLSGGWAHHAEEALHLVVDGPALETLWPGLEPIGRTHVEVQLDGDWAQHHLHLQAEHFLNATDEPHAAVSTQNEAHQRLGTGWVRAALDLDGALAMHTGDGLPFERWAVAIKQLQLQHGPFTLSSQNTAQVQLRFAQLDDPLLAELGPWTLRTDVAGHPWLTVVHEHSQWQGGHWSTKGRTEPVRFAARFVDTVMQSLGLGERSNRKGGIIFTDQNIEPLADVELQLDWDVAFRDALGGRIRLYRVAGDIMVPDEPPFPLGLEEASATIVLTPQGGGRSQVKAAVVLRTAKMGYLQGQLTTPLYYSAEHGFELRERDLKTIVLDAQMDDLSWTSLIIGDAMDLGGELDAQVQIQVRELDNLTMQGQIRGQKLRVTRLDDGVRLLDGTLEAHLEDHRFVIDKLYFPARLRVEPKEWRTATWISEEADAKNGYIDLSGFWDLDKEVGHFDVVLHRYPILQRADRYAMMSGELTVDAVMPQINIKGHLTADAGWFDLDMLGGIPTVDSDVVVLRAGETLKEEEEDADHSPLDMSMDIEIDLGPRFYLTGYGVNSGLVGQLRVMMVGDQLTGLGALRTRGGAIEIYGQRLLLRRGTITFQGDITNPILNIEALRTGLPVEAGVRVAGTAHHPKIDLVSYPEVDELAKLSWLLFGHGPDESGGDVALLISVGTSMLSDGEPFYKRFGIDELSLQAGDIAGAGSILPPTSTASSMESEVSEVEKRFIQASKIFGNGFTIGVRQALADSGTVGRATYRLSRRLTGEITLGTVSGIALLYRWFSRDD